MKKSNSNKLSIITVLWGLVISFTVIFFLYLLLLGLQEDKTAKEDLQRELQNNHKHQQDEQKEKERQTARYNKILSEIESEIKFLKSPHNINDKPQETPSINDKAKKCDDLKEQINELEKKRLRASTLYILSLNIGDLKTQQEIIKTMNEIDSILKLKKEELEKLTQDPFSSRKQG